MPERVMADLYDSNNHLVRFPQCCGQNMADDGECYEGCCDIFKCGVCGKRIQVECAQ